MEGEHSIIKRPTFAKAHDVQCRQRHALVWPIGTECWLVTDNLGANCFAFAIILPIMGSLYHVKNESKPPKPGENSNQPKYDYAVEFGQFQTWLGSILASDNINEIQLYVTLPTRATDPGQLEAAKEFVQTLEQKSGLTARGKSYAPMPKEGWATMEIYSADGKGSLPLVYVNGELASP